MSIKKPGPGDGSKPISTDFKKSDKKLSRKVQDLADRVSGINKIFAKTKTDEKLAASHAVKNGPVSQNPRL